jgi:hypothetical protein
MILYSNVLPTTTTPLDSLFLKQTGVGGIGTSSSIITFYEFDDTFRCINTQQSPLTSQNFGLISDIGVTQDWYVLIEPPMEVKNKVSFAVNKDPGSSLMTKENASAVRLRLVCIAIHFLNIVYTFDIHSSRPLYLSL